MALSFPELVCLLFLTLPGLCTTNAHRESLHRRAPVETGTDEVSVLKERLKAMNAELQETKTELQGTKSELQGTKMELQGRKTELHQLTESLNSLVKRDSYRNVTSRAMPKNPCYETCTKLEKCKAVVAPVIAECTGHEWIMKQNGGVCKTLSQYGYPNASPRQVSFGKKQPRLIKRVDGVAESCADLHLCLFTVTVPDVFQRRKNGSVNFDRNWEDYKWGFGDIDGGFWLGLHYLHQITSIGMWELRVDLSLWNGNTVYATYSGFKVGPDSDGYRLHLDQFTGGNAGDSLSHHNGLRFSTPDVDNDLATFSCAARYHGAWWYRSCYYSNLNGLYYDSGYHGTITAGIRWLTASPKVMNFTQMKMRRM